MPGTDPAPEASAQHEAPKTRVGRDRLPGRSPSRRSLCSRLTPPELPGRRPRPPFELALGLSASALPRSIPRRRDRLGRWDVLVDPEEVVRVVLPLQRLQAMPLLGAIGRADPVFALLHQEVD